jgi:succinate dehydrogenase / fumarate reductase cytochrome b subunit
MWSWVAHRITGVLTFFFLFAHVLDTALVRVSPEAYNEVIETYKNPFVNLMEVGLVGAVLYHLSICVSVRGSLFFLHPSN